MVRIKLTMVSVSNQLRSTRCSLLHLYVFQNSGSLRESDKPRHLIVCVARHLTIFRESRYVSGRQEKLENDGLVDFLLSTVYAVSFDDDDG